LLVRSSAALKMARDKRRICVLSGKRGGFGALIRTMQLIEADPLLDLQLVVTDMHLSEKFGRTVAEVQKWFDVAERVDIEQKDDTAAGRSSAIGVCLQRVTRSLERLKPDVLLVIGDRGEVLASTIAAVNLGIAVAHIQGGDISGSLDEVFRHAITKLAHLHFPSNKESARRIERMGEERWRIHVVGDPHIDLIKNKMFTPAEIVRRVYNAPGEFMLVLQHPVTTEPEKSYEHMKNILAAVKRFDKKAILVYPCSDQGYQGIIDAIHEGSQSNPSQFEVRQNIEAPDFLGLLSCAEVLIGNSSSGLIEAPYFRLPVVNVGRRQAGRLREHNVIDVEPKAQAVFIAIRKALYDKRFRRGLNRCGYLFGDGRTGERIVRLLKNVRIDRRLLEKRMTY
jgi:GDP/UDP-N,N'-diacetylbacillosamine 2-epimerase (hydrolysing)